MGIFTASGLKEAIKDGKLNIINEGKVKKFVKKLEQITFSAKNALANNAEILYVTERAVFRLTSLGLELTEIAKGVDLEKDILNEMEFKPFISSNLKEMDERIFKDEKMNLKL